MRFGSVCSGIEAASAAWESLGWSAAWFAEIEAFPSAVLAHHFPNVMNVGDMTTLPYLISAGIVEAPDVLVGGTPCQAFSVAGNRKSLDDDRGQLSLEYCKIADAIDGVKDEPCIAVWENVPGVLSTKDNAFGCFLGELSGAGEQLFPTGKRWSNSGCVFGPKRSIAWRLLDAQYFGLAQRRKRVFVVASARKDFNPAEILLEFDGVRRDTPPSRETRENPPRETSVGFAESSFGQYREAPTDAGTLKASGGVLSGGSETFIVGTLDTQCGYEKAAFQSVVTGHIVVHGTQDPITSHDVALPLGRNNGQENAVFSIQGSMIGRSDSAGPQGSGISENLNFTLTRGDRHAVARERVRRLLPVECERLQGFPDNWTRVPYRNKPADQCPDGPRYMACGNSMAVTVMRWIGFRIDTLVNKK